MIKLIGSDIDGTLTREGSTVINPEYFHVIRELKKYGIKFCACSGRQYQSMYKLLEPVADDIYFICEIGTLIRTKDEILHSWHIEEDLYAPLVEEIRSIGGLKILASGADMSWIEEADDSEFMHLLRDDYRYDIMHVDDLTGEVPAEKILKLSIYHPTSIEEKTHALREDPRFDHLNMVPSGSMFIDIYPREAGKGEAFALLQEYLEIGIEETVFFGDNLTDIAAFKEAGVTATVANARPEVQDWADKVELSYSEDGVLRELHNLLKHRKDFLNAQ